MSSRVKRFWESLRDLRYDELRSVADLIHGGWEDRDCDNTSIEFAEALSDYADQGLVDND